MNNQFKNELVGYIKSMIEISNEFIGWDVSNLNKIFILCSTEEGLYFTFFYSINGKIVDRDSVNNYLNKKVDVSDNRIFDSNEIGLNELENIMDLFDSINEEIPKLMKIGYNPKTEKMDTHFSYESQTGVTKEELVKEWMQELLSEHE